MSQPYTADFFADHRDGARRSARVVVPLVLELVRARSVVDVGCGDGTWLSVFREHGVEDVRGIDGDYVDRAELQIPRERFHPHDLTRPLELGHTFDLAVSLEVAEHLPPESADDFVTSLTRHAPIVLFSAAAPYQGGQNHVNEQWPAYWAARFASADTFRSIASAGDCGPIRTWSGGTPRTRSFTSNGVGWSPTRTCGESTVRRPARPAPGSPAAVRRVGRVGLSLCGVSRPPRPGTG